MNALSHSTLFVLGLSLGVAGLAVLAVSLLGAEERRPALAAGRPIPPMDAAAPKTTEAATFASG